MFCPQCGKELKPNAIFCSGCGRKLPDRLINEIEPPQAIDASSPYDVQAVPFQSNTRNINDTLVDISQADTESEDVYTPEQPLRREVNALPQTQSAVQTPNVTYEQPSSGTSPVMVGVVSSMATLLVVAFVLLFIKPGYLLNSEIKTDSDVPSVNSVVSDDKKYSDTVTSVESQELHESSAVVSSSSKAASSSKTTSVKAASKLSASKTTSKAASSKTTSKVTSSKTTSKVTSSKTTSKAASSKTTSKASSSKTTSKVTSSKTTSKVTSSKTTSKVTSSKTTSKASSSKTTSKVTSSKAAESKVTSSKAAESKTEESKTEEAVSSQQEESSMPSEAEESDSEIVTPAESDTQTDENVQPPVESEPEQDQRNEAYEEAMKLSTNARPSFDEFEWCFGQNGLVYMQPEGTESITDPLGFSGGWKAMVIYNPSNIAGTFIRELDNVNIGIYGESVDFTIDWYLMSVDIGETTNEESMPDTMFIGEYSDGGFRAFNGQRTVNMVSFWREGESQYAIGTLTTEDGLPAYIALKRP